MSALQFQKAMAHLIRYPEASWESMQQRFLDDLSARELHTLEAMSRNPLVRKFGYKMRFLRYRDAKIVMRISLDFVEDAVLEQLFVDYFEPSRKGGDLFWIGVQFLEFCLQDPNCLKALAKYPAYVKDVIRYEATRATVERLVIDYESNQLPERSLLAHDAFRILELDYDIPTVDKLKVSQPESKPTPQPKQMTVLVLRSETTPYYRIYQIDSSIAEFLKAQRENPSLFQGPLPAAYSGMVACGLCRDVHKTTQRL